MENKFPVKYVLLSLASILVLIAAQIVASGLANLMYFFCGVAAVGNAAAAVIYPLAALAGLWVLCRTMGSGLASFRITKPRLDPFWSIAAFLMPALACGVYLLLPGSWVSPPDPVDKGTLITAMILYTGFAAGIVEEMVFRGMLMTALERRWGRKPAVLAPSLLFGVVHIIGVGMTPLSMVLTAAAGTMVGVLFSLVAVETGSIWSGALMHSMWNIVVSGVLHIGPEPDPWALLNYVPENTSVWLTGGDFGVEASAVSAAVYGVFAVLALVRIGKKRGCEYRSLDET